MKIFFQYDIIIAKRGDFMATSKDFLVYILDNLSEVEGITFRQMMGEYIIYMNDRIAAYVCDNRLLIKPVPSAVRLMPDAKYEPPYEGAKEMLLCEYTHNREFLKMLFESIYDELPQPKKKKKQESIMANRLYVIEGLPCSGKSTTSAFVAKILKQKYNVCYVDEGSGNHPADYEFHAFLDESKMRNFSNEEQTEIISAAEKTAKGYIVPLSCFSGELFDKLLQYKIYDFLPWETEKALMLEKWRSFVSGAGKDTVYVFNCVMLQNPMCETMMRFGFSENVSSDYIKKIAEIAATLEPVVIYLKNDDIRECVERTSAEREGWLEAVTDYHVNGGYGKSIDAKGFNGYIQCLEERQRRELRILSELDVKSLVLDNAHRGWNRAYEEIRVFLK